MNESQLKRAVCLSHAKVAKCVEVCVCVLNRAEREREREREKKKEIHVEWIKNQVRRRVCPLLHIAVTAALTHI